MPSDTSARLSLPYLAAGQLQKHVTLNQALTRLDALAQTAVISRTTSAQPASPSDGDLYILPSGATGADWSTRSAGDLMRAETGGWTRIDPVEGMIATVLDAEEVLVRRAGSWTALATGEGGSDPEPPTELQNLTRLGINATADVINPFAARLNKALWTARDTTEGGDGDLRMTFNKQTEADVLSLLFQSGYGARAELGLIGDDDFRLKVSPDGVSWHDALIVDAATGTVQVTGVGSSAALQTQITVLSANATYSIPAWAKHLQVTAIGGGGGGSGMASTAASTRFGGGGGGAGGISTACWPRASLGASLTIVVGAGGAGGASVASGNGLTGGSGASSTIANGSTVLLTATGGAGGQGGSTGSGNGGVGGRGVQISNSGASSAASTAVLPADSLTRSDGSGGGGGGGGLSSGGTVRAGSAGGIGSILHQASDGGAGGNNAMGGTGVAPADLMLGLGSGGGGGGANAAGAGFAAGSGAAGAGGGGGGAGTTASGAGGNGGGGLVRVTAIG